MDKNDYLQSLAYCGLICKLCLHSQECSGCKTDNNVCSRNCSPTGCYQVKCCLGKGFDGCWECDKIYDCREGIYSADNSPKVKAFAVCIREDGAAKFISYILENMRHGWSPEKGQDYDRQNLDEILMMLRLGSKFKNNI